MNRVFFVIFWSSLFFACGPTLPKVNNSTPASFRDSLKQVEEAVPESEKDTFNLSKTVLLMENMKEYIDHGTIIMNDKEEEQVQKRWKKLLHGKNYKQIINEADKIMLAKMERAQKQYATKLREITQGILNSAENPQFQGLAISHSSLTKQDIVLTVQNRSTKEIAGFVLGAVDMEGEIPFIAVVGNVFSTPLPSGESRVVSIKLDREAGWDRWINGNQTIGSLRWIVYGLAYVDGKELTNAYAVKALAEFVPLRRKYELLVKSKKDWKSAFNVDNVVKGFFPFK